MKRFSGIRFLEPEPVLKDSEGGGPDRKNNLPLAGRRCYNFIRSRYLQGNHDLREGLPCHRAEGCS